MRASQQIRVLHVDDESPFMDITKRILADEGVFHVENAVSVDEALSMLEHSTFDVVVCDYEMPLKNGLDLLKTLREQGSSTPFILFTGRGREEIVVKALNLGADPT